MSEEPEVVIPLDRLPPGFAERIADPPADAAEPKPAATVVLVRDGDTAPEILLLKRHRNAGFVPGAYVFPGGRVDEGDSAPELIAQLGAVPAPAAFYWLAAVREAFEETGVLLARTAAGEWCRDSSSAVDVERAREALLVDGATLYDVLQRLNVRPDLSRMVYCAHWITPVAEPRRYDTRFFLAELPAGSTVTVDAREMDEGVWVTAADALARFRAGTLPMVFPTVKTIQRLAQFTTVGDMLAAFRAADVEAVLPRLVRTADGVGIVMDE